MTSFFFMFDILFEGLLFFRPPKHGKKRTLELVLQKMIMKTKEEDSKATNTNTHVWEFEMHDPYLDMGRKREHLVAIDMRKSVF
jgi:hypothetical protein